MNKQQEINDLILQYANEGLSVQCHAVPIWHIPGFYFDQEGHQSAKRLMEEDAQAAYTAAMAYRLTGDAVYAEQVVRLLDGWASVNQGFADNDGPLVSAYVGTGLIQAAEQVKDYEGWSMESKEVFARWLTDVCMPAWDGITGRNNWWSWSLYAQLCVYRFLEDIDGIKDEAMQLKAHIDESMEPSGFIPEETERGTNAMWYHYFSLAPMTAAARIVADRTGEDLFRWISPRGNCLKKALDTLLYYVDGPAEQWPFEKEQNVPAPLAADTWPLDLYEGLIPIYNDPKYEAFVKPYRPITGHINRRSGYFQSYAWCFPSIQL